MVRFERLTRYGFTRRNDEMKFAKFKVIRDYLQKAVLFNLDATKLTSFKEIKIGCCMTSPRDTPDG